ncbi:MAG TPA: hypothetical protein VJM49_13620 [Acidimicrobiales bacterium]|nr:hypothetical protein [Acidimicrobiales bacterium]
MPIVVPTPNTTITSAWGKSVADAINAAVPRELAYAQVTASKTVTAGAEVSADPVVLAPSVTFDGSTVVLIEFFTPAVAPAIAANANVMLFLYQDGASIGRMAAVVNPAAANMYAPVYAVRRMTPTAGAHQYTFAAIVAGGNGTVVAGPGGVGQYMPAFIRISKAS